jgi:hypothetical protein
LVYGGWRADIIGNRGGLPPRGRPASELRVRSTEFGAGVSAECGVSAEFGVRSSERGKGVEVRGVAR